MRGRDEIVAHGQPVAKRLTGLHSHLGEVEHLGRLELRRCGAAFQHVLGDEALVFQVDVKGRVLHPVVVRARHRSGRP